jgi:hypothetical protein
MVRPLGIGEAMITVKSPLWVWRGEGTGSWHFLTIPEEQAGEFRAEAFGNRRGFGSVRVAVAIGDVRWRTSVFPASGGGYLLPDKADVRKRAGIAAGDDVTASLEIA